MSDDAPQPTALETARQNLARARSARARLAVDVNASASELKRNYRAHGRDHARTKAAASALAQKKESFNEARRAEREAKRRVSDVLSQSLSADPAGDLNVLSAEFPIVLFPVRLETRFSRENGNLELKVRIYPDDICADTHEPELTEAERLAGERFWRTVWRDPAQEQDAWRLLVAGSHASRAAWIALATTPENLATRPSGEPGFPPGELRSHAWTRAAEARILPDRWVLIAYRNGKEAVPRVVSRPVEEPLALTLSPDVDPADPNTTIELSDGLRTDPDVAWTFDFARAERAGMGLRIPLKEEDFNRGFDRLVVVGVKSTLSSKGGSSRLTALIENHHYTRGFAFVPLGTPTNNTRGGPSGFPPADPGGSVSFSIERGTSLVSEGSDGELFMRALGISSQLAAHVAGADRREQQASRAMNDALWPATFGYFLEQMMVPVFDQSAIAEARRHFVDYVQGRGPLPAFRIGGTPYGLLPVTSLSRWLPYGNASGIDLHLPQALRTLREIWNSQIARVPRVGQTPDDPDQDLLAILGMHPSTREIRVRSVFGGDFQRNLLQFLGVPGANWFETLQAIAHTVFGILEHPEWNPRLAEMIFAPGADPVRQPFVTHLPLSEQDGLRFDYIRWIRTVSTVDQLRDEILPKGVKRPTVLLYQLLRHAALAEYARIGFNLALKYGVVHEADRREPELVGIAPGTKDRATVWQRFDRPIPPLTGKTSLGQQLLSSDTGAVHSYRASLRALEGLPTAELERLMTETLDTCSHRLDAWITSLPSKRLEKMRAAQPMGSYLGAFGWVENLRPGSSDDYREVLSGGQTLRVQNNGGGYVHAPSMNHAATAAILRNGYLTRTGDDRTRYAINLSSERVRTARSLLDGVRQGQPLGALLGYRLERALHDKGLDQHIETLRRLYPLAESKSRDSGDSAEAISARDVVDGLALLRASIDGALLDRSGARIDELFGDDADALKAELRLLDAALDSVADLLTAESVYQIIRGSNSGAAASLDAMAEGVRPPDPEIAYVPRGGTALTHRVGVVLGSDPIPVPAGWPVVPTPRAQAEPFLDGWFGSLIGDPRNVRCRVSYLDPTPYDPANRTVRAVSLAELGLRPLDVLALSQEVVTGSGRSELDKRIAYVVLAEANSQTTDLRIMYGQDSDWDRGTVRTFPEILEFAKALQTMLGAARPLRPADLLLPEAADSAVNAGWAVENAVARANTALHALALARAEVDHHIGPLDRYREGDPLPDLSDIRRALLNVSRFGLSVVPETAVDPNIDQIGDVRAKLKTEELIIERIKTLLSQAKSAKAEIDRRFDLASRIDLQAVTDQHKKIEAATELVRLVFGREFLFLPGFTPSTSDELAQAIAVGPTLTANVNEIRKWLRRIERVRPSLQHWRNVWLYAEALGAARPQFDLVQLPPTEDARWIALSFNSESERPPSGRISIVLHRPVAPAVDVPWVGLLIDEWPEIIPNKEETTGIAFHYDDPGAEAAQAVLIAVPPTGTNTWDLDTLIDIVNETLDLAKLRAVDSDYLGMLGQLLPAVYLAANAANETVATNFVPMLATATTADAE